MAKEKTPNSFSVFASLGVKAHQVPLPEKEALSAESKAIFACLQQGRGQVHHDLGEEEE